ncbi:MAG: hypothetical protein ABIH08_06210 [Candidatus Omnitrophota bacterium]
MSKKNILIFYFIIFILLTAMFPELSLGANISLCREVEGRGGTYGIEEIKFNKNNCLYVDFFQDRDILALTGSIQRLESFITLAEPIRAKACLSFSFNLFNHSPPIF